MHAYGLYTVVSVAVEWYEDRFHDHHDVEFVAGLARAVKFVAVLLSVARVSHHARYTTTCVTN